MFVWKLCDERLKGCFEATTFSQYCVDGAILQCLNSIVCQERFSRKLSSETAIIVIWAAPLPRGLSMANPWFGSSFYANPKVFGKGYINKKVTDCWVYRFMMKSIAWKAAFLSAMPIMDFTVMDNRKRRVLFVWGDIASATFKCRAVISRTQPVVDW